MVPEGGPFEIGIGKTELLKHGSHGAVEDENTPVQRVVKLFDTRICHVGMLLRFIFPVKHNIIFFEFKCKQPEGKKGKTRRRI